jgi:hypothetical protein
MLQGGIQLERSHESRDDSGGNHRMSAPKFDQMTGMDPDQIGVEDLLLVLRKGQRPQIPLSDNQ